MSRLAGSFAWMMVGVAAAGPIVAQAQVGTAFMYQGRLQDNGQPYPDPTTDLSFNLFGQETGGTPINPSPVVRNDVPVLPGGLFMVEIDFGEHVFTGGARWLAITVNGVALTPR